MMPHVPQIQPTPQGQFVDLPLAVSLTSCPLSPSSHAHGVDQYGEPLPVNNRASVSSLMSALSDDTRKLSLMSVESDSYYQALSSSDLTTPDAQVIRTPYMPPPFSLGTPRPSLIPSSSSAQANILPSSLQGTPLPQGIITVSSNLRGSVVSTSSIQGLPPSIPSSSSQAAVSPVTAPVSVSSPRPPAPSPTPAPASSSSPSPASPSAPAQGEKEEIVKDLSKCYKDRPCKHNQWRLMKRGKKKSSSLDPLRCLVCGKDWLTDLKRYHEKCEDFYNGNCKKKCAALHLWRSGSQPTEEDETDALLPPGWEPFGRRAIAVVDEEGYYKFSHYPADVAQQCEESGASCVHHY
eukprot:TRINITY_DN20299_c0_g1_i1.p1 TRINITY_DN20299_c0_g1~~TRINITY_DN20299_c0_g1_i1.p1  ORF type:complete len:350 (+),score=36.47 TRINITY_DN20299_c0_g1_i1:36-1085(+)